jgi:uncharacterized membrane protein YkoI
MLKPALMLTMGAFIGFMKMGMAQTNGHNKLIKEDRACQIATEKLGASRVEFIERIGDDHRTVYEVYIMKGDTLLKAVVNGYTSKVDTVNVYTDASREKLQARILAKTRAENVALAAVSGEVARWKLKYDDGLWCYRFRIETPDGKLKEVFVDRYSFKLVRVKEYETDK